MQSQSVVRAGSTGSTGQPERLLERLGLSKTEARVYLCLLERSPLAATEIADLAGAARSSVYHVLRNLVDKGLIEAGAGYNSRYHAVPPRLALTGLLDRERAELDTRENHLEQALPELTSLFAESTTPTGEAVEILRTPALIAERFERLQAQAEATIDIVVRGPLQVPGPNEAELAALERGVQGRAIYDQDVLQEPTIDQHLGGWTAGGEQARVFRGKLPMKFAVFDTQTVLMPLVVPGVTGLLAIIVRNKEHATALEYLFNTLWERSEPLEPPLASSTLGPASSRSGDSPRTDTT